MESVNPNAGEYQAKDPVCGMMVDPQNAAGFCDYQGPTYFFCSVGCLNKFRDDPTHFLDTHRATPIESQSTSSKKAKAGEYACPMHPEIVRDGPGSCPICGMTLEPRVATGEEEHVARISTQRGLWVSVPLTLPLLLLAMSEVIPGDPV